MKFFTAVVVALSMLASVAHTAPDCPTKAKTPKEQEAVFNAFVQQLYVKKNVSAAFTKYVDSKYIQHNPYALSGRDAAITILGPIWPSQTFTIIQKGFVDCRGFVHYKWGNNTAVVDLFRMEGGCIMEHWDVVQEKPKDAINPIAMW